MSVRAAVRACVCVLLKILHWNQLHTKYDLKFTTEHNKS